MSTKKYVLIVRTVTREIILTSDDAFKILAPGTRVTRSEIDAECRVERVVSLQGRGLDVDAEVYADEIPRAEYCPGPGQAVFPWFLAESQR